jgi:hydrogenase expression/formation protein HypE
MDFVDLQDKILLAHGSGGQKMHKLLQDIIFSVAQCANNHDAAAINLSSKNIAFTADSFVVNPLFFPGADIGLLAVYGTVNDLAMAGAIPKYLSLSLILEEGFAIDDLKKILISIKYAADKIPVKIITGDTKVVERGHGHGIYINTTGIGEIYHNLTINPCNIKIGDQIILSGDIGRHGIAIMAQREGLDFKTTIESDCAPLHLAVQQLVDNKVEIHCLRDITRGGLATTANEFARDSGCDLELDVNNIPVMQEVQSACELLGLDPMHVACEGRFLCVVPKKDATMALQILQNYHDNAAIIGEVVPKKSAIAHVTMQSCAGVARIVSMLSGEQLPRIC